MKSIFARHGIPSVVVNDNATCYSSRLYREFVRNILFCTGLVRQGMHRAMVRQNAV